MENKAKHSADNLLKKYSWDIICLACDYFDNKGVHCTIEQLEQKCKELKNKYHGSN